jgi:hypothetical protein
MSTRGVAAYSAPPSNRSQWRTEIPHVQPATHWAADVHVDVHTALVPASLSGGQMPLVQSEFLPQEWPVLAPELDPEPEPELDPELLDPLPLAFRSNSISPRREALVPRRAMDISGISGGLERREDP